MIAAVAVAIAAVAVIVVVLGLNAQIRPVQVAEATVALPPMTKIAAADVTMASVPKGQLGKQRYFMGTSYLVGRYALYGLAPVEIVSPQDIAGYSPDTSTYAARLTQLQADAQAKVDAAEAAVRAAGGTVEDGSVVAAGPAPPPPSATLPSGSGAAAAKAAALSKAKADLTAASLGFPAGPPGAGDMGIVWRAARPRPAAVQ